MMSVASVLFMTGAKAQISGTCTELSNSVYPIATNESTFNVETNINVSSKSDAIVYCAIGSTVNLEPGVVVNAKRATFFVPASSNGYTGDAQGVFNNEGTMQGGDSLNGPSVSIHGNFGTIQNGSFLGSTATIKNKRTASIQVYSPGTLDKIINYGTLGDSLVGSGIFVNIGARINTISNFGTITTSTGADITNSGIIGVVNNLQGGSDPLKISGEMPNKYSIIINNDLNYGRAVFSPSGFASNKKIEFNISDLSEKITQYTYSSVIQGLQLSGVSNQNNFTNYGDITAEGVWGSYLGAEWKLVLANETDKIWDLVFLSLPVYAPLGPLASDTFLSFVTNQTALRNAYNLQSANITQSLSYDCTVFDAKNICASFTGTRSDQSGSNLDSTTGTLVIAHRPAANVRFGGYINQSLNTSEQGGLRLERSKPGMGAFVNYAMTSGLNIRGSVGFGKLDMQTTREALGTAEAGVGKSNITTQGAQLELSEAFDIKAGWTAVPYAGIRKVTNKRAAYSEIESEAVSAPLTYADLKQTQTTAFGGIRFNGQVAPQLQLLVSAGFESDRTNKVDDYIATGVDGLGSISMQENVKKTRPVFATSLSYDIAKNERASIAVLHRQEAFDSKKTTSVGFIYTKGF